MARRPRKRVQQQRRAGRPKQHGRRQSRAVRPLQRRLDNLPAQLTSFVGREREIAEIKRLLGVTRLLTLIGPGGCGKTRLALRVTADLLERYPHGVWFVELASLSDPALVPNSVAAALGVPEQPRRPLSETLASYLESKRMLLLIDNCEHLRAACQSLTDLLLRAAATTRILVTSREALGVEGELTYRVPSLRLPDARHALPVAQLGEYDAIRLFADRAALSQPGFALTEGNASAIGQICQRLDGMPLAIEFAAARVRMLSIEQIAARLDDLFRLLTAGTRRVLPRQQTLRATMDWSYDLLMEHERTLFRRLSVFAGGFTMEAAENIGAGNGVGKRDILDLLTRLVDKSLVVFDERNGQARYRLLESVRQYGRERLQESGEANDVQRRHRDWHLDLAERAESQSRGHDQDAWLDRLETEHDNMRAALAWSKSAEEGVEAWLRLAGALSWFWYANGHWSEGRRWLEDALSHGEAPEPSILFEVVRGAWTLAYAQADFERMRELREKFMALSERLDNKESSIIARVCMGLQAVELGEPERAIMLLEESVTLARAFGDKWVLALALGQLSYGLNILGNHEDALRLIEESVHLLEDFGDKWRLSVALRNWGTVLLHQHDYDRAATCYADSIRLRDPAKNMWVVFQSLEGLACVASARRQYKRAAVLFGAAKPIQESLLSRRDRDHQIEVEQYAKATRTSLGEEAFVSASTEGRAMTLDQAVQFALAFSGAEKSTGQRLPAKRRDGDLLTVRERDVVRLVARGLTNRAIAATLVVSGRTVDAHVQNILNKLGFSSRAQIAAWAVEQGLTGDPEAGTAMPDVRPSQPGRAT